MFLVVRAMLRADRGQPAHYSHDKRTVHAAAVHTYYGRTEFMRVIISTNYGYYVLSKEMCLESRFNTPFHAQTAQIYVRRHLNR